MPNTTRPRSCAFKRKTMLAIAVSWAALCHNQASANTQDGSFEYNLALSLHGKPSATDTPATDYSTHGPTPPTVPPFVPAPNSPEGEDAARIAPQIVTPPQQPYLFNLQTPEINKFGKSLADKGVYITGFDVTDLSAVVSGGRQHGVFGTSWTGIGTNLDLDRILGIAGAQVHFMINDVAGQGAAARYTGSSQSGISNWANHNGLQLRELSWDQMLANGKIYILAGRTAPKSGEYESSELYCQFATFLCSSPTMFAGNGSAPSFVTSTWGGRVMYKPTINTYIKAGIWETEPFLKDGDQENLPGEDWALDQAAGAFIPLEAGYRSNFTDDPYPRQLSVGFYYDTTKYASPLFNTHGQPLPLAGGTAQSLHGRTTVYVNGQKMVWKPDPSDTRGVILFGAANFETSGQATLRDGFVAGIFDWGPTRSRPRDSVGIVVQTLLFNNESVEATNLELQKTGQHGNIADAETMMELTYGFNIAPGVKVSPYFEYIWDPDQMVTTTPQAGITHAIQIGAMLDVELNELLDLPNLRRIRN